MFETSHVANTGFAHYGLDKFDQKFQFVAYSGTPETVKNSAEHFLHVARKPGYDGIKGDVRITKDGTIVMCHDEGFTFDGNGKITRFDKENFTPIIELTSEEVFSLVHAVPFEGKEIHPTDLDTFLRTAKGLCLFGNSIVTKFSRGRRT